MKIFGKSIKGRRSYNQDSIYYLLDSDCYILAVADGMGGSRGGKTASKTVIDQCEIIFQNFCKKPAVKELKPTINNICLESQKILKSIVAKNSILLNMGTTLTIILGYKGNYVVGNIGDSRTYLLNKGSLHQITKDNSYIQEYADKNNGVEIDQYMKDKLGHIITKAISASDEMIDKYPENSDVFKLEPASLFLLCSDGFFPDRSESPDERYIEILEEQISLEERVEKLMQLAYDHGSSDNISIVLGEN